MKIKVRSYRPARQLVSAAHIYHRVRERPLRIVSPTGPLITCFREKGVGGSFQSIPLLDEHDITIEYLENLENLMFQKYFQLASMIDPIIDNCYHIQTEH